jgi:two-component system, cell cycle response regulator DivK
MATILVIEDKPANMKLANLLLHNAGHRVLCAVDAESGLLLACAEQPDLILMDLLLPGMDGLAATARLKQDLLTSEIPIVALTAMTAKEDVDKSDLAGCDAHITKPLHYDELYKVIDIVLARRKQRAASADDDSAPQAP